MKSLCFDKIVTMPFLLHNFQHFVTESLYIFVTPWSFVYHAYYKQSIIIHYETLDTDRTKCFESDRKKFFFSSHNKTLNTLDKKNTNRKLN